MDNITGLQRDSLVRAGRAINSSLDYIFYDLNALSSEEKAELSARNNPEGSILIVHPKADTQNITKFTPLEFISGQTHMESDPVDAIVVAGVGSSALGTAALARNVADYLGRPVAGVVSGYGMADMLTEALGGWFVFGYKNQIRDSYARMFDALEVKDHVWDDASYQTLVKDSELAEFDMNRFVYGSPDSAALLLALYHLREQITVLVGHSKGNYVIENALEGLVSLCGVKNLEVPVELQVVTLGAVVRFPGQFPHVHQFIGQADIFGMLNSRISLQSEKIPGARHSLNSGFPWHISVAEAMESAQVV